MQKEQYRICSNCSKKEVRSVDYADCIFLDSRRNWMHWIEDCTNCGSTSFSERGERFLTSDPQQMILPDSIVEIWLRNDDKLINLQDEYSAFMYLDIKKLFYWLDKPQTTTYKKHILVEALCERLNFEFSLGENTHDIQLLMLELKNRKELVSEARSVIDPITKDDVFPKIGLE